MSVVSAILFYSKHDKKSLKLKSIIDDMNIDIETLSVDTSIVRQRLQQDDKYEITQVPSILVIYTNDEFKVFTDKKLDIWFNELLENVKQYFNKQQEQYKPVETTKIVLSNEQNDENSRIIEQPNGGQMSPVQESMIKEHIRSKEEPINKTRKEVKAETISAAEMAKQMLEQREKIDEKIEENRPFI